MGSLWNVKSGVSNLHGAFKKLDWETMGLAFMNLRFLES